MKKTTKGCFFHHHMSAYPHRLKRMLIQRQGHSLWYACTHVSQQWICWCVRCCMYAQTVPKALLRKCRTTPNANGRYVLKCFQKRVHPKTGEPLTEPDLVPQPNSGWGRSGCALSTLAGGLMGWFSQPARVTTLAVQWKRKKVMMLFRPSKTSFVKSHFIKNRFCNVLWWKNRKDRCCKNRLWKIDLAKNLVGAFDNFFTEENVEKMRRRGMSNNPRQEKTWIPSKNRYKVQNNNPKMWRAPLAARALLFWILYRFFVGIRWSFGWASGQVFLGGDYLTFLFDVFFDIFFCEKNCQNRQKYILTKRFFPNRFLQPCFLPKSVFPKPFFFSQIVFFSQTDLKKRRFCKAFPKFSGQQLEAQESSSSKQKSSPWTEKLPIGSVAAIIPATINKP